MKVILKSGREMNPHRGIWGLTPELILTDGFDGMHYDGLDDGDTDLNLEDKRQIATEMIERWKRYAELM
jgi:hypothetical protein